MCIVLIPVLIFFLVDNRLLPSVFDCKYNAIVISDHAPMSMNISFKNTISTRVPWRLNTRLLSNVLSASFHSKLIFL